jgi:predicted O-methyltransferase YrrM
MQNFFTKINNQFNVDLVANLRNKARENGIPIIRDESLSLLCFLIRTQKSRRILELGTAIGYSAICMALCNEETVIDTIEKNQELYETAIANVSEFGLNHRINLIVGDATETVDSNFKGNYDLIFIDAAKTKYQKFFENFEQFLSPGGIIVCDNVGSGDLVGNSFAIKTKNKRHLVQKIEEFDLWLALNKKYETIFLSIDDGLSVSVKK